MKTKPSLFLARTACVLLACGGSAAAQSSPETNPPKPEDYLPKPSDPVVLPTDEETAQLIKNMRESNLRLLKYDKDGWDDIDLMIWKSMDKNYKFEPDNKIKDTDGDGMSDYEEMLVNRNPLRKEPIYTKEQLIEQVREGRRQAIARWYAEDKAWKQALVEAAPQLRSHVAPGKLNPPEQQAEAEQNYAALRAAGDAAARQQPGLDARLAAAAARLGVPLEEALENGSKKRLSGFMGDVPFYMADNNHFAAAAISADELWPLIQNPQGFEINAPLSEANTGLGLSGAGQTLGMWEVGGGVRLTHGEFAGRVVQPDAAALDTAGHATNVAGSMVAAGNSGLAAGLNIAELKGVAYGANARAFNTAGFNQERLDAAGGANNTPQVFLSNHSWGVKAGWNPVQSVTLANGTVVNGTPANPLWTWDGSLAQNFQEHFAHGFYTPNLDGGDGCTQIDHFHHTQAPRHLMVFAAGNDWLEGPGAAVTTYYTVTNNVATAITSANPNYTRDWADGDEGGFDSLDAPGTAKNCLTVGACQDVFRIVNGNQVVFGFAPGVTVTNANFSGSGPTDDGRIKPDLVAVGAGNPDLRLGLGYFSTNTQGQQIPWDMITTGAGSDNNATLSWAGTSAACPTVTAALGLLTQRRQQLYPTLTAADALRGSTLKALAIDGADDVGPPGPSYDGGHGLMNARTSVERLNQDQAVGRGALVKEFTLAVGQSASWITESVPGALQQTHTLVWSDPQGPARALATITAPDPQDVMLVNNINVQVQHIESGTIFNPWTLNPDLTNRTAAARSAAAVRAVDQRNNVERITIPTPLAGHYRITVTHAGNPTGMPVTHPAPSAQVVSLVSSGIVPELPKITSLIKSAPATEWMLNFTSDPGAVYTIQTSTDLQTWTGSGTVMAAAVTNSVVVNSAGGTKRFWRLRRGQWA